MTGLGGRAENRAHLPHQIEDAGRYHRVDYIVIDRVEVGITIPMSVIETDFDRHISALSTLFREYHEWMKREVIETIGGGAVEAETIEEEYDIEAIIGEDIDYLTDPDADGRLFAARQGGEIVGCVYLKRRSDEGTEVKRLYVRPEARGHGLGRALMEAVIESARADGEDSLLLYTAPFTEAAQSLYEELGFEYTSPFPCEAPEDAYDELMFMRLDLDGGAR